MRAASLSARAKGRGLSPRSACSEPPAADSSGIDSEWATLDDDVLVRVDERDYFRCWRSSYAPKKDAALFRTSAARRSSRFSCSSSRIRRASAVLTSATCPSSTTACLTHVRTDSIPWPNCVSIRCTVPCSVQSSARNDQTIQNPTAFSSDEYRRVVGFPDP